jgi:hypothetical protein
MVILARIRISFSPSSATSFALTSAAESACSSLTSRVSKREGATVSGTVASIGSISTAIAALAASSRREIHRCAGAAGCRPPALRRTIKQGERRLAASLASSVDTSAFSSIGTAGFVDDRHPSEVAASSRRLRSAPLSQQGNTAGCAPPSTGL